MDWKKPVKFKIGDVDWEMPLHILILLGAITLILMGLGAWMGFRFGSPNG